MADAKISQLTEATPAAADYVPILDVSDTAMGPSGSTRKARVDELPFDPAGTAAGAVEALADTLGTAATRDVGTAAGTVCAGDDARLSDARTPTAHTHPWSQITSTPTTLAGYGITDGGGAVESVNGYTGAVTLTADDVGAAEAEHTHGAADLFDHTTSGDGIQYLNRSGTVLTEWVMYPGDSGSLRNSELNVLASATRPGLTVRASSDSVPYIFAVANGSGIQVFTVTSTTLVINAPFMQLPQKVACGGAVNSNGWQYRFLATVGTDENTIVANNTGSPATVTADQILARVGTSADWHGTHCAGWRARWVDSTDATRRGEWGLSAYDAGGRRDTARGYTDGSRGYTALRVHATAPADADLQAGEVVFYTDGSGQLVVKLKDSGGTVRTGSVALT